MPCDRQCLRQSDRLASRFARMLHIVSQNRIDPGLIAWSGSPKEFDDIFVQPDAQRFFGRWDVEFGIRPIDIERHSVRVAGNRRGNVFIAKPVKSLPVGLSLARLVLSSA